MRIFLPARGNGKCLALSLLKFKEFQERLQHLPSPSEFCNDQPTTHEKHFSLRLRRPQQHPGFTKKEET